MTLLPTRSTASPSGTWSEVPAALRVPLTCLAAINGRHRCTPAVRDGNFGSNTKLVCPAQAWIRVPSTLKCSWDRQPIIPVRLPEHLVEEGHHRTVFDQSHPVLAEHRGHPDWVVLRQANEPAKQRNSETASCAGSAPSTGVRSGWNTAPATAWPAAASPVQHWDATPCLTVWLPFRYFSSLLGV